MKLATLLIDGKPALAVVSSDEKSFWTVEDLTGQLFPTMTDLIDAYTTVKHKLNAVGRGRPLGEAQILPPLKPPRNIICVGKNYRAHAREFADSGFDSSVQSANEVIPSSPIFFTKPAATVIGTSQTILYPKGISEQVDYEAELGVVIARAAKAIPRSQVRDHIFGYVIVNDVTARDLQAKHKQWFLGKSLDTFCPMGPWLVTADEVDDKDLDIRAWVNGELRQNANTKDLIFDVECLVETLSAGLTLLPGDVIATGTPEGVGIGFNPPRFLKHGDEIRIEITGLGRLVNQIC